MGRSSKGGQGEEGNGWQEGEGSGKNVVGGHGTRYRGQVEEEIQEVAEADMGRDQLMRKVADVESAVGGGRSTEKMWMGGVNNYGLHKGRCS